MLTPVAIGRLFDTAAARLSRQHDRPTAERVREAERRLDDARARMMNWAAQRRARDAYMAQQWEVTSDMYVPINVAGLEEFAATDAVAVVPVRNSVPNNTRSFRDMIRQFMPCVERPAPQATFGWRCA